MKKIQLILGTLCLGLTLSAQPGIISTRPANPQNGKILTMEETILSGSLSPANLHCTWNGNVEILVHKDGKWQAYDIKTSETKDYVPAGGKRMTAYVNEKSLWLRDKDGNDRLIAESESPEITYGQFTSRNEFGIEDGIFWSPESENSQITYGQFVSRNEFGISDGIFWAPDRSKVAFSRKDESRVTTFPLLDITTRTGTLKEIKYPMAGMDSENVQVWIYDIASG